MKRLGLALCLLLTACGGAPELGGAESLQVVSGDQLPPPSREDLIGEDRPFYIGPFDRLTINVFGIEELNEREVTADASGRISFPLVGVVEAAGKTPRDVEEELTRRLQAAHVRDPQVTVNIKEAVSQQVTVDGQVTRPGLYPVVGRMTLMRAIATAQGVSELANLQEVVLFRKVEGRPYAALYDLAAIRRGAYEDPDVYGNDIVIVGDSKMRRLMRDLFQAAPLLSTPLIVAMQSATDSN